MKSQYTVILAIQAKQITRLFIYLFPCQMKFEREKFYPGQGIEPGPLDLRASALPLRHPGQLPIQGKINLFKPILSDLRTTNSVPYRGMHSYI